MAKRRQLRGFDLKQIEGVASLIGVDEVGRGAFAGPVVAAAVMVTREFLESRWAIGRAGRINDSKLLTAELREELYAEFEQLAGEGLIHAHVGAAGRQPHAHPARQCDHQRRRTAASSAFKATTGYPASIARRVPSGRADRGHSD